MTRLTNEYNTEHASALLENDDEQNDEQREEEAKAYNELDETKDIKVGDGYITSHNCSNTSDRQFHTTFVTTTTSMHALPLPTHQCAH